jgi:hypothetical protein
MRNPSQRFIAESSLIWTVNSMRMIGFDHDYLFRIR